MIGASSHVTARGRRVTVKCSADPAPTLAPLLSVCLLFEMINNVTIVIGCPEAFDNITVNLVNAYSRINCIIMVTMNTISTTSNIGILLYKWFLDFKIISDYGAIYDHVKRLLT